MVMKRNLQLDKVITTGIRENNIVDFTTGEVITTSTTSVKTIMNPDRFCLVYSSFWDLILDTNLSKADLELFSSLVKQYGKGTPFTINSIIKSNLSKRTGKHVTSYDRSTRVLLDAGFIIRVSEGKRVYVVNPKYAFEGSSSERKHMIVELISE